MAEDNGRLGFIKSRLAAARIRAERETACTPASHQSVMEYIVIESDVTLLMLDEFKEMKEILMTFVEQRRFIHLMWKGVAGILGVNGILGVVWLVKQISISGGIQ